MIISKIIRITIALTVLALLGAAGAHWYLQHKVENLVEETIKELYPVAVISYEDTYSSLLDSSIGVERLTINPRAVRDEIKIERIVFQAPSIRFLLDAEKELENGDIPEKMRISFENVTLSTEGNIARSISRNSSSPGLGARDTAYGCAAVKQFGFSELAEMGYEQISIDLNLSYEYNPSIGNLNVSSLWSNRRMFELEILGIFEVENHQFKLDQTDRLFDLMSRMKITYRDLGFNQNTIDFCNIQRGDQDYVSAHIEAFKQDLQKQLNIVPSNALVEAYRTFMLESGVIDISSNLQSAINPDHLALYSPKDLILLVRPDITVNGQPVDIPYADLLKDSPGETESEETASTKTIIVPESGNKPEYVTVTIPQLADHIGDLVRVKTKQGTTRTGILVDTSRSRIKVEISHRGGSATYPIYVRNIAHTEVMEIPKTDVQ
jgi:hypothetical protein